MDEDGKPKAIIKRPIGRKKKEAEAEEEEEEEEGDNDKPGKPKSRQRLVPKKLAGTVFEERERADKNDKDPNAIENILGADKAAELTSPSLTPRNSADCLPRRRQRRRQGGCAHRQGGCREGREGGQEGREEGPEGEGARRQEGREGEEVGQEAEG